MKYLSLSLALAVLKCHFPTASVSALELPSPTVQDRFTTPSSLSLVSPDEPRFSMRVAYGEDPIPATAVFMSAIELTAQYTGRDFLSRTRQRHGIVLPEYPQVEIALLAAGRETQKKTIQVRLAVWALYGALLDIALSNRFKECEWEILWDNQVVATLFFTQPLDVDSFKPNNETTRLIPPLPEKDPTGNSDPVLDPVKAGSGHFEWKPIFLHSGNIMLAKDIFLLTMGTLKAIAPKAMTDKVPGPFHVSSEMVDANLQAYLENRRVPRPTPPFFQFAHVLEATRRIPAWMLAQRKFAEFFCSIEVSTKPVGALMIQRGPFVGHSIGAFGGNVSTS
ncbi:MAG: hypothetical protein Q9188_002630 [Gyalolechia gomerana]